MLDDLERALDAAEHHEEAKVLEGVRMTKDALAAVLASEGVEEIPRPTGRSTRTSTRR